MTRPLNVLAQIFESFKGKKNFNAQNQTYVWPDSRERPAKLDSLIKAALLFLSLSDVQPNRFRLAEPWLCTYIVQP